MSWRLSALFSVTSEGFPIFQIPSEIAKLTNDAEATTYLLGQSRKFSKQFWKHFGDAKVISQRKLSLEIELKWRQYTGTSREEFEQRKDVVRRRHEISDAKAAAKIAFAQARRVGDTRFDDISSGTKSTFWNYFLQTHGSSGSSGSHEEDPTREDDDDSCLDSDDYYAMDDGKQLKPWCTSYKVNQLLSEETAQRYQINDDREGYEHFWHCPITNAAYDNIILARVHLAPGKYGPDVIASIFGEQGKDDFNTPNNTMIMHPLAEETFDAYLWTMEPDIQDFRNAAEVKTWLENDPKEYRILVLDNTDERMNRPTVLNPTPSSPQVTIASRHGQRVAFRNDFRPKWCYIYMHWALATLRNSVIPTGDRTWMEQTQCKLFFASVRPYFKQSMLSGVSEYLGLEHVHFFPLSNRSASPEEKIESAAALSIAKRRYFLREEEDYDAELEERDNLKEIREYHDRIQSCTDMRDELKRRLNDTFPKGFEVDNFGVVSRSQAS